MERRRTKEISLGKLKIGGGAPVTVQSMLNMPAHDIAANVRQAKKLAEAGCEIIRFAVPDRESVALVEAIKKEVSVPLVADIHFDYRIALDCAAAGVDAIRINPGNIGEPSRVKAVADACRQQGIPIRIGVNSGSVETELLKKYGRPSPQALCESALGHARLLEQCDFEQIVLSLKSSSVKDMAEAYELVAQQCDYPLHLGVTEAGTERMGLIRSSAGIGSLLLKGIGDTIRVSLTADPVREVAAGIDLLRAIGMREEGCTVVSCPTCGRTKIDLIGLANEAEQRLRGCKKQLKVAIMGCAVNGPGEAREADVGIAGGDGCGLLFKKGKIIRKVYEGELLDALLQEIDRMDG